MNLRRDSEALPAKRDRLNKEQIPLFGWLRMHLVMRLGNFGAIVKLFLINQLKLSRNTTHHHKFKVRYVTQMVNIPDSFQIVLHDSSDIENNGDIESD
ncbi:hypothetical protein G7B40_026365 [Aetokthonos hydrillicola Thurmond2011]|uniref:Uncharacterized protein n=1 Tax=Aetokthonos hydrillicola Thurmond2011 TaxID=2712845 RepID=A0AAP5IAS7_9CYAN|nr:hypothetical protein [Aetokthonos hydrillicola CCALA 1050]MDR9898058.1 hypothetical protein [Aetokthonos hydrillicola Thurmond2011]